MKNKNFKNFNFKQSASSVGLTIGLVGMAFAIKYCIFKVEPGSLALKFSILTGVGSKIHREGYHFLIPFIERPIIYDCRMKNDLWNCACCTKGNKILTIDLQIVRINLRLISRPNIDSLPQLYRLLGMDFKDRVLNSVVYEICGSIIAQYNAAQLITQRDTISFKIKQKLFDKAKEFHIDIDDCALV
jgi:prohibitin 2